MVHVNFFEITFKLKKYDYRIDGKDVCCLGFSWNHSTEKCESKDIKDKISHKITDHDNNDYYIKKRVIKC